MSQPDGNPRTSAALGIAVLILLAVFFWLTPDIGPPVPDVEIIKRKPPSASPAPVVQVQPPPLPAGKKDVDEEPEARLTLRDVCRGLPFEDGEEITIELSANTPVLELLEQDKPLDTFTWKTTVRDGAPSLAHADGSFERFIDSMPRYADEVKPTINILDSQGRMGSIPSFGHCGRLIMSEHKRMVRGTVTGAKEGGAVQLYVCGTHRELHGDHFEVPIRERGCIISARQFVDGGVLTSTPIYTDDQMDEVHLDLNRFATPTLHINIWRDQGGWVLRVPKHQVPDDADVLERDGDLVTVPLVSAGGLSHESFNHRFIDDFVLAQTLNVVILDSQGRELEVTLQ